MLEVPSLYGKASDLGGSEKVWRFELKEACRDFQAILVLPDGCTVHQLEAKGIHLLQFDSQFSSYFSTEVPKWYEYSRNNHGHLKNGQLAMIVEAYLVDNWAIATSTDQKRPTPPFITHLRSTGTRPPYKWDDTNEMSMVTGPVAPKAQGKKHCVAIRLLSLRCKKSEWKARFPKASSTSPT